MAENLPVKRRWGRVREWSSRIGRSRFNRALFAHPVVLALLVSVFLGLLIAPHFRISLEQYDVGEFAEHAIKAERDFDVEDVFSTERRREEAAAGIYPIYDHDSGASDHQVERVEKAFAEMRAFFGSGSQEIGGKEIGTASLLTENAIEDQQTHFSQTLGIVLDEAVLSRLAKAGYPKEAEEAIRGLLKYALTRLVVHDRSLLQDQINAMAPAEKAINLRELVSKKERLYSNLDQVLDLETLRKQATERAKSEIPDKKLRQLALAVVMPMLGPTLDFNRAASEDGRDEARAKVGPSIIHFRKHQLIVAEGEPIAQDHLVILRAMQSGSSFVDTLLGLVSVVVILFMLIVALFYFAENNIRKFQPTMRDYGFLIAAGALAGLLIWLGKTIGEPLAASYTWLTPEAVLYMFPVAGVCMLVRFLLYSEAALVWLAFVGLVGGLMIDNSIGYAVFVIAGSIIGAHRVGRARDSRKVVQAGVGVALVNAVAVVALQVMNDPTSLISINTPVNMLAAMFGGLASGPFMVAVLQPFEAVFGYTSNIRLMEQANLNHPLLGRLLVEAPGTYHHSLMVSALAEKGAEAIGANPLLVKVAGLYHDIGKTNKPHYFIENQYNNNPHDDLPATMSALILINHVREGLDLARRFKLGERVQRIISEHHGRSRINYFYNRAKQHEVEGRGKVNDEDFRYRGPRPQSKESALVMLADVVEAATRSLQNPTPTRIENIVKELIGDVHNDGQLNDCEMTLEDLHKVAVQFTTILTGRYHGRIAYPGKEGPRRGKAVNIPAVAENGAKPEGD
jgi:cyclic-di-AMP phosphodiesterase PgpH